MTLSTHMLGMLQGKTLVDHYIEGGLPGRFIQGVKNRKFRKAILHEYLTPYDDPFRPGKKTARVTDI